MNPVAYCKTSVTSHFGIFRRCCCHGRWLSHNKSNENYSKIYKRMINVRSLSCRKFHVLESPLCFISCSKYTVRSIYSSSFKKGQEPSSKVEETVNRIKEENKEKMVEARAAYNYTDEKPEVTNRTLWQKIKCEIIHYYHGFRLLGLDMKISAKLIFRILQGQDLSRREHRLLVKTTGDMFRLIPFSVFIIVPFMEFLLPLAIKFFPGLLPSTFQTATEKEDKLKQALKVKIEMAKFLQKTLDDMAVQSSEHRSEKAKEFTEFFYKLRSTGAIATNEEIMKFSKLFEDEITLDSLSRLQLIALCKVLDVQTLGTTNFLRFLLRMRLRSLAADDRLIEKEGIESLTRAELQLACKARGMRAYGMPESKLREQLIQWLDLSLDKKVPPSLLLLSRALMVPDTIPMSDKLKATISALPDTVVARTKGAIGEKEGKMDHRTNIEIIKIEEQKIEEERQEKKEIEPLSISNSPCPEFVKQEEITISDVKVLEQALDTIGKDKKQMTIAKEEIKELKEEMADYQEDIQELYKMKAQAKGQANIESIKVSKGARRLFNKVNKMVSKMDAVLTDLEKSEKKIKEEFEALPTARKTDWKAAAELVRIDELIATIKKIQNVPDDDRLRRIAQILGKIDDDRDGAIKIEDVLKVVELIGKEDIKLSQKQVEELIDIMGKEEVLEVEDQIQRALLKDSKQQKIQDKVINNYNSISQSVPISKRAVEVQLKSTLENGIQSEKIVQSPTSSVNKDATSPTVDSDERSSTITSNVSRVPKKSQGSKHL